MMDRLWNLSLGFFALIQEGKRVTKIQVPGGGVMSGGHDHITYPCPLSVPCPEDLWLCMGSSRKLGRRGCFLAERAALLGRNVGSIPLADGVTEGQFCRKMKAKACFCPRSASM